jgi:hypothetical protein
MEGDSMNCIKHRPNIKGAKVETMGDRARVSVYVATEDKDSQEMVVKRSEAVSRSKEKSEWNPVKVCILTGSSLI